MAIRKLKETGNISDAEFDFLYPSTIALLSARHWTSMLIARIASGFLCTKTGSKILDIGSGVGKFCLIGASLHPDCFFHGIEIRSNFVSISRQIKEDYTIENVTFTTGDIIDVNLQQYDGLYFFNSFHEHIDDTVSLGKNNDLLPSQYVAYVKYLFDAFKKMPLGTRLVTYHTSGFFVPGCYEIREQHFGGTLKLYEKTMEDNSDILFERTIANHILLYGS